MPTGERLGLILEDVHNNIGLVPGGLGPSGNRWELIPFEDLGAFQELRYDGNCDDDTNLIDVTGEFTVSFWVESTLGTGGGSGSTFEIGDVVIDTFSIPHDAYDPVGFMLRTLCGNIGFLTDLGHATKLVVERVRASNVLVLETNHDVKLLQEDRRRPWSLKQRILSRHGHLSNDAAADCVTEIMSGDLHHLLLGHLSRDCNKPEIAERVMRQRLQTLGASHVHVTVTQQSAVSPTLTL